MQLMGAQGVVANGPTGDDPPAGPTFGGGARRRRARPDALARAHTPPLSALKLQLLHDREIPLDRRESFQSVGTGADKLRRRAMQHGGGARDSVNQVVPNPIFHGNSAPNGSAGLQVCGHPPREDRRRSHPDPKVRVLSIKQPLGVASQQVRNTICNIPAISDHNTTTTRGRCLRGP